MSQTSIEPAAPRGLPAASMVQKKILATIREHTEWIAEDELLKQVEAKLRQAGFQPHTRDTNRWILFSALRCDDRLEQRLVTGTSRKEFEYRVNPDWPGRYRPRAMARPADGRGHVGLDP